MPKLKTEAAESTLTSTVASKKDKKKAERQLRAAGIDPAKKSPPKKSGEVVYPEVRGCIRDKDHPDGPITEDDAKLLLGWEVVSKGGGEYLLTDHEENQVRCTNNQTNRPFGMSDAEKYEQEILRKRWCGPSGNGGTVNGETLIVGKTGTIISGQHRLIALVLACQTWRKDKEAYPEWETAPVLETFLALGIDESDKVVNTVETGRSRSGADILFRSEYFADLDVSARKTCSRACEHAVRLLWDRTGVETAFDIYRTTSEILAIVQHHRKLVDCVRHVVTENVENKIGNLIPLGNAAALCYLMATSKTDPKAYYETADRDESLLDFSEWDAAQEFWVNVAQGQGKFKCLHDVAHEMRLEAGDAGLSLDEKRALIVKAWNAGKDLTPSALKLSYHVDEEDGTRTLEECPTVGGIDRGDDAGDETILNDEEVAEVEQEDGGKKSSKKQRRWPKDGDEVWIDEGKDKELWKGKLLSTRQGPNGKTVAKVEFFNGKKMSVFECDFNWLHLDKPHRAKADEAA